MKLFAGGVETKYTENPAGPPSAEGMSVTPGSELASAERSPSAERIEARRADALLGPRDVHRVPVVALRRGPLALHAHRTENRHRFLQPRVRDENILIGETLDLEAARRRVRCAGS
jgi:hypothetical protein